MKFNETLINEWETPLTEQSLTSAHKEFKTLLEKSRQALKELVLANNTFNIQHGKNVSQFSRRGYSASAQLRINHQASQQRGLDLIVGDFRKCIQSIEKEYGVNIDPKQKVDSLFLQSEEPKMVTA